MRLPAPLSRKKQNVHKNDFGHVLILAGSRQMVGAAALTSLAAMRAGAGLVTVGLPGSLNSVIQKKISPVVMTLPLPETSQQSLSVGAFKQIKTFPCDVAAIGPGLSRHPQTRRLILNIIVSIKRPLVIDADALNAVSTHTQILLKNRGIKILTPHPGEMARLTGLKKEFIERNRLMVSKNFAARFRCTVILKGHHSLVVSPQGKTYLNKTGNPGMATAGSGDVLTGIISAFLAQGLDGFEAAKLAVYIHGRAGDLAAKAKTKISLIATDIIEYLPPAFHSMK